MSYDEHCEPGRVTPLPSRTGKKYSPREETVLAVSEPSTSPVRDATRATPYFGSR